MPGGDRTGPWGAGPLTGRGVGLCAGYGVPGYMNPAFGRGFGRGWGRGFGRGFGMGGGRGWRHQYYATGWPGWASGYAYPYPYPAAFPVAPGTATNAKTAQAGELTYLKEQAQYFKDALREIESRVNELQQKAENVGNTGKKKEK